MPAAQEWHHCCNAPLTFSVNKKQNTTNKDAMLDTLKSLLMIGSPTQNDGPLWPFLLAGALAAAALLNRIGRD